MEQEYRLVIKASGKWHIGIAKYTTKEQAQERREYLISIGAKPQDIKVKSFLELFPKEV